MEAPEAWVEVSEAWVEVSEAWLEIPEAWLEIPEAWLEVPEAWLEVPEAWLEAPEAWLKSPEAVWGDVRRYGRPYRRTHKIPLFYRTSPPSGRLPKKRKFTENSPLSFIN